MLRGAVAGTLLLAGTFVLSNTTRAVAVGASTVEAVPSVKAAVDGVLELFRKNSVYFEQERRRLRCCTPFGGDLDWDQILQENSVVPRNFKVP